MKASAGFRPSLPVSRPCMLSSARTFTYFHHDWPSKVDVPGWLLVCANADEVIKRKKMGRRKRTALRGITQKARLLSESLKLSVFRSMINSFHNFYAG